MPLSDKHSALHACPALPVCSLKKAEHSRRNVASTLGCSDGRATAEVRDATQIRLKLAPTLPCGQGFQRMGPSKTQPQAAGGIFVPARNRFSSDDEDTLLKAASSTSSPSASSSMSSSSRALACQHSMLTKGESACCRGCIGQSRSTSNMRSSRRRCCVSSHALRLRACGQKKVIFQ